MSVGASALSDKLVPSTSKTTIAHSKDTSSDGMIRFVSAGVKATLATADLDASLSRSVTLTMGKEQARDDQRVDDLLAAGTLLGNTPIGVDGGDKGILQYIGEREDIAFMMTEAGEMESQYVSLTPPQPQALRLTVESNEQAHRSLRSEPMHTDLKIETYLNGQLSDVYYINPKKSGTTNKYTLNGARIHRQIEKPWTYTPAAGLESSNLSALERWDRVSASLRHEVRVRGTNKWGDTSSAGAFLAALADVSLPARLQEKAHLSIIDVIIVAGKGGKDGPSHGYIARPTRMRSDGYQSDVLQGQPTQSKPPVLRQLFSLEEEKGDTSRVEQAQSRRDSITGRSSSPLPSKVTSNALEDDPFADNMAESDLPNVAAPELLSTSSDVPLATRQQSKPKLKLNLKSQSPTKLTPHEKAAKQFAEAHGISYDRDTRVENFKSRRGKECGSRKITQRIGDIQKMTPKNQGAAIRKLKEELGQFSATNSLEQSTPARPARHQVTNPVKLGPSASQSTAAATAVSANQGAANLSGQRSELSKARTRMAIDAGAAPEGRLVEHIASFSSPQHSANIAPSLQIADESPAATPTRTPRGSAALPETPKQNAIIIGASVRKSSRKPGKLDDQTLEEALANFRRPEMCRGSVVGFAGGDAQRQIQKMRTGFFEEEQVIVGMRFVVV